MSSGKSSVGLLIGTIGFIAFLALMSGVVGAAIVPALLKAPAPVVCPEGTVDTVVVRTVSYPEPGTTSVSGRLHCLDITGCATTPNEGIVIGTLFGMAFAGLTLVFGPLLLFTRVRPKNRLKVSDS